MEAEEVEIKNIGDEEDRICLGSEDGGKGWNGQDLKGLGWKMREVKEPEISSCLYLLCVKPSLKQTTQLQEEEEENKFIYQTLSDCFATYLDNLK